MLDFFDNYIIRTSLTSQKALFDLYKGEGRCSEFILDVLKQDEFFVFATTYSAKDIGRALEVGIFDDKLIKSLFKYFIRYTSRATPYGCFAGVAIGTFGDCTSIKPILNSNHILAKPKVILDWNFMTKKFKSYNGCEEDMLILNPTTYSIGQRVRFYEFRESESLIGDVVISEFETNEIIEHILGIDRKQGRLSKKEIISFFVGQGFENENIVEILEELKGSGFLLSPFIWDTNRNADTEQRFLQWLKVLSAEDYDSLANERELLKSGFVNLAEIKSKQRQINGISEKFQIDAECIFVDNVIDYSIQDEIRELVELFKKIGKSAKSDGLKAFSEKYTERYGDRMIPLLEALDTDFGLGYPVNNAFSSGYAKFVKGINYKDSNIQPKMPQSDFERWVLGKLIKNDSNVIVISKEDVKQFRNSVNNLPPTFSVLVQLFKYNNARLIRPLLVGGSSAAHFIGRFADMGSSFKQLAKNIGNYENGQRPIDAICAEIKYISNGKVANISCHTKIFEYDIDFSNHTDPKNESRIPVNDLYLKVVNGEIELYSMKHRKFVLPKLSFAHNYDNSIPAYNFLCDLQTQFKTSYFDVRIDSLFMYVDFIPRVMYENSIIISRAQWKVTIDEIDSLILEKHNNGLICGSAYLKNRNIPSVFVLGDGDNELSLKRDDEVCLSILIDQLKKRKQVILFEDLNYQYESILKDEFGNEYVNEVVFLCKN